MDFVGLFTALSIFLVLMKIAERFIDAKMCKKNGNPGHLTSISKAIDRIDQTLDSIDKGIALLLERTK